MVVVAHTLRFDEDDPRPMFRHLDQWSRSSLTSPEAWGSMLERCDQWADYSARNQVLLASYGVVGPVAGSATWDRVPSTEPGRGCAVRTGERGLPVRVPVVEATEGGSDRTRSGAASVSAAASHRWEPVFALEQLARRPASGALEPPPVPRLSNADWLEAVRVASGRMLGRTPRKIDDPGVQLGALAGRVWHGSGRVRLDEQLRAQAGWLVASRVGRADDPIPAFDPSSLSSRERWRTLVDVRHATGQVLSAVSFALESDLAASMLPRHAEVDDRSVVPGRRNYLAPADVRALPLAVWVEAGPYTKGEWLSRGIGGAAGRGAFMRVNERSYLAAYETRTGAMWRLETTGRGAHNGLVAEGSSDTLDDAKDGARQALAERYPAIADAVDVGYARTVVSPACGWVPLADGRDGRTEQRTFDERVAAMVSPGPGGRWQTWTCVDGTNRQGPLAADSVTAKTVADGMARGALMELAAVSPDRADALVRDLATSDGVWRREAMVAVIGHRLTDADRAQLATTESADQLVRQMLNVGVLSSSTMLSVLRAEGVDAATVAGLIPTLGTPIADAVRTIHHDWGMDRLEIGSALGATNEELRAAGCSAVELLAAGPREELRRLDSREQTWMQAAPMLLEAGFTPGQAVAHLAAHAPTPETFAAGVVTIVDDPVEAFALAARRATTEDLVALSERFTLSPQETAETLATACVTARTAIEVIHERCEQDFARTVEIGAELLGMREGDVHRALFELPTLDQEVVELSSIDIADIDSIRVALGPPDPSSSFGIDDESLARALSDVGRQAELEVEM
ncbi:MAG: hypothetical protein JWM34_3771 [Ilumatobacteraceae bacterium]|nr:hypothetical protein [Ilumatobacteraceae bacterium]